MLSLRLLPHLLDRNNDLKPSVGAAEIALPRISVAIRRASGVALSLCSSSHRVAEWMMPRSAAIRLCTSIKYFPGTADKDAVPR